MEGCEMPIRMFRFSLGRKIKTNILEIFDSFLFQNLKMNLQLNPLIFTRVPYLEDSNIEEHLNLTITSEDGHELLFNNLFLVSWSEISKRIIEDAANLDTKMVILSNFSRSDLKVFQDFIMKGVLPMSDADILRDMLPSSIQNIFSSFGMDLKKILKDIKFGKVPSKQFNTSYPKQPQVNFKSEIDYDDDYDDNFENYCDAQIKTEDSKDAIFENDERDFEYTKPFKEKQTKRKKKIQLNNTAKKNKGEFDYEPFVDEFGQVKEEKNIFNCKKPKLFSTVRGLSCEHKQDLLESDEFVSEKTLLKLQEKIQDKFKIRIPPPDFTEEDYKNFVFPKPVDQLKIIPEMVSSFSEVKKHL